MYDTKAVGNAGEKIAQKYLKRKFYKILDCQYRSPFGEIDIIAQKKNYLIFAEVKTRREDCKFSPASAVNKAKQQRIIKTAFCYIKHSRAKLQPRFDIIEVIINPKTLRKISLTHIENAFTYGGGDYAPF